jgi:putative DNA primase/helicase
MIASLRALAHDLGGEVVGGQVLAPGPGHSRRDRSLAVRFSPSAPDGFLVFSHAGDDFAACRDHVRERLGLAADGWKRQPTADPALEMTKSKPDDEKVRQALALWGSSADPRGTLVERYLASRSLILEADVAGEVLRWRPSIGAMLALMRNIHTGEPQAVSRRFLGPNAEKLGKPKFLGPVKHAAVMLDDFADVTNGLHIAEGVETAMSARVLGLRPTWALGSVGAIADFPVLGGVEVLTLLAEHDDTSARAVEACAVRWHEAEREVLVNYPLGGKDLNDTLRGAA